MSCFSDHHPSPFWPRVSAEAGSPRHDLLLAVVRYPPASTVEIIPPNLAGDQPATNHHNEVAIPPPTHTPNQNAANTVAATKTNEGGRFTQHLENTSAPRRKGYQQTRRPTLGPSPTKAMGYGTPILQRKEPGCLTQAPRNWYVLLHYEIQGTVPVTTTQNNHYTTFIRKPIDSTFFDCQNGSHQKRPASPKQLTYIAGLWNKRGLAGPFPCCAAGAQRQLAALKRIGVHPTE